MENSERVKGERLLKNISTVKKHDPGVEKISLSNPDSNQSCKTLKLISKNGQPNKSSKKLTQPLIKKPSLKKETPRSKGQSEDGNLTDDKKIFLTFSDTSNPPQDLLSEKFYKSDTYRCIVKERETILFVKRVKRDIETELAQRIENCKNYKLRLQALLDQEKQLVMAIDGEMIPHITELENLQ